MKQLLLGATFVPHFPWSRHTVYLFPSPITSVINATFSGCSDGSSFGKLSYEEPVWCESSPAINVGRSITRASENILSWILWIWCNFLFFIIIKYNVLQLKIVSYDSELRNFFKIYFLLMYNYWKRSLRGCNHLLTCELDSGNWRLFTPSSVLGTYIPPTLGVVSRIQPWDSQVSLTASVWYTWLNSVKTSV